MARRIGFATRTYRKLRSHSYVHVPTFATELANSKLPGTHTCRQWFQEVEGVLQLHTSRKIAARAVAYFTLPLPWKPTTL